MILRNVVLESNHNLHYIDYMIKIKYFYLLFLMVIILIVENFHQMIYVTHADVIIYITENKYVFLTESRRNKYEKNKFQYMM